MNGLYQILGTINTDLLERSLYLSINISKVEQEVQKLSVSTEFKSEILFYPRITKKVEEFHPRYYPRITKKVEEFQHNSCIICYKSEFQNF